MVKKSSGMGMVFKILISDHQGGGLRDQSSPTHKIEFSVQWRNTLHVIGIFTLAEIRLMLGRDHSDYQSLEAFMKDRNKLYPADGSAAIYTSVKTLDYDDFRKWAIKFPSATPWTFLMKPD